MTYQTIAVYTVIAEGAAALEGAIANAWGTCVTEMAPFGYNLDKPAVVERFSKMEAEWDAQLTREGKPKSKPGAYRSAKSVVCTAIEKGVPLYNEDGSVRGKTEVEKECKEPKTDAQKVDAAIKLIGDIISKGYVLTADQKDALRAML